jgi:hypothetical protein
MVRNFQDEENCMQPFFRITGIFRRENRIFLLILFMGLGLLLLIWLTQSMLPVAAPNGGQIPS